MAAKSVTRQRQAVPAKGDLHRSLHSGIIFARCKVRGDAQGGHYEILERIYEITDDQCLWHQIL